MKKNENNEKMLQFDRGVEQGMTERDDGSKEINPGEFKVFLADGRIACLWGTNRATAVEYKRVSDKGFTETEIRRILNNGPFSNDSRADCERIISALRWTEHMMVDDLKYFLKLLRESIITGKNIPFPPKSADELLEIIHTAYNVFRLPMNLEIAEMSKRLKLTGDKDADSAKISSFLDIIEAGKIRKFPKNDHEKNSN